MQPLNFSAQQRAHLARVAPVVGRAGVVLGLRADERAVLDARDVARVRAARGRSSGAWRPRAARTCRPRRAPAHSRSYSSAEPSHQWTSSGSHSSTASSTQSRSRSVGGRDSGFRGHLGSPTPVAGTAQSSPGRVGHQHEPLELGHEHAVLVEHARVHAHRAAVGLGLRLAHLEHLGLAEQRVAVEHRRGVLELLGREVGDRLARDVRDAHARARASRPAARRRRCGPAGTAARRRR